MLSVWLTADVVQVVKRVADWQEAVALACQPLVDNGAVQPTYIQAIYHTHATLGPYYVIAPGIALPHAKPEMGVNRSALALLVVTEGVSFNAVECDPVRIVAILAAKDNQSHIDAISQLATLLDNHHDIKTIATATDKDVIMEIIARY